jgi:DNA repair protein RadD
MELRPYQTEDLGRIRASYAAGNRRVLYQAPTGSGKTVLFSVVVAEATARGNRTVILGHRDEIVRQISSALDGLEVPHGIIAAGYPETSDRMVQVASAATLVRRLSRMALPPDLIVIDEAHHAAASTWQKILAALPESRVLGVTATPQRLDGKGLDDIFDELIVGPAISELIAAGFLANFGTFAPARMPDLSAVKTRAGDFAIDQLSEAMSSGVIITTAVDEYIRLCPGVPAIAFCVDIAHSKQVAAAFVARGFSAAHVDGETPADERRALIAALGNGGLQVLTNCGLISEGLDVPGVVAAILLRPTRSLALYLQQVGRALRPAPGKARALILDHAGNTYRFGAVDAARRWSLAGRASSIAAAMLRCPECGLLNPAEAYECAECGVVLRERESRAAPLRREHSERFGPALIEMNTLATMNYGAALKWAGSDRERLKMVATARGYKQGWVWHRLQELAGESVL